MGVFSRLGTLIKSNLNDMISRAEDPEKVLNQLILDMREQLINAKKQVAVAIADEKRLKKQLENEQNAAREWEKKAMMAVRANRDDLAVEALNRQKQHQGLADEYRKQWEMQKQATDQLRVALRQLNDKIEEARRKKDLLIARKRRAEAQQKIHDTMSGLGDTSAFDTFDRMSQRVDQIEAEAEASADLSNEMSGANLESQFDELEADTGASAALAQLKARMGVGEASAAQGEDEEVDFEEMERELAEIGQEDKSFSRDDF
jgi:phage shock protein A